MRLEQLEYLLQINKDKSLNRAAQTLNISVQALSLSLNSLEKELGITIFTRSPKGVSLTDDGKEVLHFAGQTIEKYHEMLINIRRFPPKDPTAAPGGILSVYANPMFFEIGLTKYAASFSKEYPDIKIHLSQADVVDMLRNLETNSNTKKKNHIGLVVLPGTSPYDHNLFLGERNKNLSIIPFNTWKYVCAVSYDSEYASYNSISLSTIIKAPLIVFSNISGEYNSAMYTLKKYGTPKIAATVGSISAWHQAVKDNVGIGLLNTAFISEKAPSFSLFRDTKLIPIRDYADTVNAFITQSPVMPIAQTFIDHIRENEIF